MGAKDKITNKAKEAKGTIKEGAGRAAGDEELEAEGRTERSTSHLRQAGEKAKESAKKVKDAFKR